MAGCGCLDCSDITIPTGSTGPQGPAGSNGTNGTNGTNGVDNAAVLSNVISDSVFSTPGIAETLKAYTLPLNTLDTDGDILELHTTFTSTGDKSSLSITGFGSTILSGFFDANKTIAFIDIKISRKSNTTASFEGSCTYANTTGTVMSRTLIKPTPVAGLNFTTTAYTFNARGLASNVGDITCQELQGIYLHKI